jgi:hypothetical protein
MSSVHDHFDGSRFCVECDGPCRLTGAALWLSEMVRWRFLRIRSLDELSAVERNTLAAAGVDSKAFLARADRTRLALLRLAERLKS